MKKCLLLLVSLLLLFSLCACAETEKPREPYTVKYAFQDIVIDPEAHTISGLGYTYHYEITGQRDLDGRNTNYRITITYPDSSTYSVWSAAISAERSQNYGNYRYIPGEALVKMLENEIPLVKHQMLDLWMIALIAIGVLAAVLPRSIWRLTFGLFRRDDDPSRAAIIAYHVFGIVALSAGILAFILQ